MIIEKNHNATTAQNYWNKEKNPIHEVRGTNARETNKKPMFINKKINLAKMTSDFEALQDASYFYALNDTDISMVEIKLL